MTSSPVCLPDAVVFAALMPHAPILIPAVAGSRAANCRATTEAMAEVARRLVAARPAAVVLVSPHAPRLAGAYGRSLGAVAGDLGAFGFPRLKVAFPGDETLGAALEGAAREAGLATQVLPGRHLDHGSVVPLWFLAEAGWSGPVIVVALADDEAGCETMGRSIAAAGRATGRTLAVIASGDMSHRLRADAPAGFHPDGARCDAAVIALLRGEAAVDFAGIDPAVRGHAAEDVIESTALVLAACGDPAGGREVLSYEGPFGVGYGVAVLRAAAPDWPAVARRSLVAAFGEAVDEAPRSGVAAGTGVFVTLRGPHGDLRGCIGTLAPRTNDLAAEVWRVARDAAFHDRRFPAVTRAELPGLHVEVTVLEPLEAVPDESALDPQQWGVVVSGPGGRRGVLLPGIPEVTTAAEQVAIARRKAGIEPDEAVTLQRFATAKFEETPAVLPP